MNTYVLLLFLIQRITYKSNPRKRNRALQLEDSLAKYLQVAKKHTTVKAPEDCDLEFFKSVIPHLQSFPVVQKLQFCMGALVLAL